MGSTFAIIGLTIWPDLPKMQSLNHTIKTRPTVIWETIIQAWCQKMADFLANFWSHVYVAYYRERVEWRLGMGLTWPVSLVSGRTDEDLCCKAS